MARESVRDLFLAGLLPGLATASAIGLVALLISRRHGHGRDERAFSLTRVARAFGFALPSLLMPVIVLGGIYGGIFTPTEAAAVSAVYGLAIGFALYRTLTPIALWEIVLESAKSTAAILFLLSGALFVGFIANLAGLPAFLAETITAADFGPLGFLLMMNVILLIVGCFLDGFAILTIVTAAPHPHGAGARDRSRPFRDRSDAQHRDRGGHAADRP